MSEYKIYSNGETYNALSGDVNIEMTGGSVGSIVIGYYIYGSGNDRTNVNVNISGGSCGCVEKAAHYGNSWVFSEQIVLMNQELTGYVTKTDSGWVAHGDAIIPEGKTVTVGEGEVFQIESGATLTNNGTIVNNGTINTYALLNGTVTGNGTVVRNAICINDTASSITVYKDGEEYPAQTEVVDGKTYIYVPTGEIKVDMDGEVYYAKYSAEAGEFEPESEPKGVTDFTNMPTEIKANEPFTLSAVKVDEWLNTTVTYAILDDDGTDAVLDGNVLTAYGAGTIQVTVTAMDIYDYTFSKTYEIVVAYTPVSDIEIDENISVPVGDSINLSRYAVTNADASYQTIEWSVVNANGTGATITDNLLTATAAGEATIRATVRNGNAYGEDYTEDFQVGFYAVEGISVNAGSITISKKDDNTITVTGGNVANGSKDYNKNEIIRIYGETTSNTITISEGTTVNLILTDVKIDVSGTEGATPLYVNSNAQLNLTLEGTNVLSSGKFAAALGVPSGAKLVIEESSTGTLEATGYSGGSAGIGGGHGNGSGTITINGGTITAICNSGWGAGIGGGNGGSGGTTTINGGIVIARGHYTGAGIGGGNGGSGGTVTINGGTVTATGYIGIGNGESASGGTLKITGGNINGTYNITPTDGSNEVSCYTCKFIGDSEDMAGKTVTAITLENGGTYGLKDVVTFDGGSENEGYFNCYLPAGSKITSITVGGVTYNCRAEDGTCHVDHDWVDATCQKPEHCSVCELTRGEVIDHDWIDATCQKPEHCSVCELTRGDVGDHNYVDGFCTVCHGYNSDVFVIDSPEDLVAFAENVNAGNKSLSAVLEADIDMKNVAWTPVCQTVSYHETAATDTGYTGIFDGRGHTISNLTVTGISGGTYSYGLFGTVSGTVENLGMVNYTYTMGSATDARAGSIAGQVLTGGTITNCYSVGHSVATSSNIAGGIAGCNYGGTISNCYALNGSVSGHSSGDSIRWGGVVGDCKKDDGAPDQAQTYGTVSYCYTDDTQVASTQNNSANITNCAVKDDTAFASGEVTYLLNGEKTDGTQSWYQTLKTDTYPVPDNTHGTVYYGYTTELPCEVSYTNDKNSLLDQRGEHAWDTDTGVCTKCDAACTHSFDANGECLICGFVLVTDLSVKLTNGGTFAEGEYTFADNIHTINTDKSVTISGTTTSERIFISYGCDANIILAGIDINVSGIGNAYGIGIADNSTGDVTITLKEGTTNKISAGAYGAAVQKNGGYFEGIGLLTIKGDGSLEAKGGTDAAGIGSGAASTSNITITGGNIRAEGKRTAAGIGAGNYNNYCSNITITGGTVTAIGGNDVKRGAGIGAPGLHADDTGFVSNIYISGGSVKAYGLYNGSCDIGFYKVPVTPTVSAGNSASVYRLEIDNPESRDITINGKDYPDFHGDEKKIYVYLPAGTAENPNIVKFSGNTVAAYYYDSEWKTVTCAGGHTASEDDGDCTTDITCVECGYVMSEGADAHTWENGECTNTNCDIVCEHISSTDDGDCTTAVICSVCGKVITEAEAEHIDSNDDGWCDVCDSGVAPELEDGYYQIANAGNLSWFAKFVNNGEKDANAVLLDDIDMTGVAWTPICQTVSYNTTTATDTGYTG
ncbi:MAG: hypothetical protein IJX66_12715, partial [Lachnospiraceae bacterium]|nr:hypothetical protein [Lachnospiraceae bacterium]